MQEIGRQAAVGPLMALLVAALVTSVGFGTAEATGTPSTTTTTQPPTASVRVEACDPASGLSTVAVDFPTTGAFHVRIVDSDDFVVGRVKVPGGTIDLEPGSYTWVLVEVVNGRKKDKVEGGFTVVPCPPTTEPTTTTTTTTSRPVVGAIGDFVWFDLDRDGVQDRLERPVRAVTVELLSSTGSVLATQVTGDDGLYLFDQLADGDYRVRFTLPGAIYTTPGAGTPATDSDVIEQSAGVGLTGIIELRGGAVDLTWDAGIVAQSSPTTTTTQASLGAIGDYVWFDSDGDGVQEAGEPTVVGATVELLSTTGAVLATQVTGDDGLYRFDGLAAGEYQVRFTVQGGTYTVSGAGDAASDSDVVSQEAGVGLTGTITLGPGQVDLTWDAGVIAMVQSIQVSPTTAPVAAPSSPVTELPFTGSGTGSAAAVGAMLVVFGGLLVAATRRRRPEDSPLLAAEWRQTG